MNELKVAYQESADHVHELLRSRGHRPKLSPAVLTACLHVLEPEPRHDVLDAAKEFFRLKAVLVPCGLYEFPHLWLRGLPKALWNTRKPHWRLLPYMIRQIRYDQGVVCLAFSQELANFEQRLTAWDRLRIEVNLRLWPNLWTPIPAELERRIWSARPELRSELFQVVN